jgi:quercetin 2,3-dioxygenase
MLQVHSSAERGVTRKEGLTSRHSFSFGAYCEPARPGFESLQAVNEEWYDPGVGLPVHSHRDVEIITYVLEGSIKHRDQLGNHGIVHAGDVLRVNAGTGITHEEYNLSQAQALHLLQIWLAPQRRGMQPDYEQRHVATRERGRFITVASPEPHAGELKMHQRVTVALAGLNTGAWLKHELRRGSAYLHVIQGEVQAAGWQLESGDALKLSNERALEIESETASELLLLEFV